MENCKNCNKEVSKGSIRCRTCSNISRIGRTYDRKKGVSFWSNSYRSIHHWVRLNKPKPKLCIDCNLREPLDVANISGKYRRNINDFEWLCRSCHMNKDNRIKNLKQYKEVMII